MKNSALRTRLTLAALALLGLGIALHDGTAVARLGDAQREPAPSLVVVSGDQDLAKFGAVDMADALGHVAGAARTTD
jgi:hypothetical protein